ncbi:hypothetical protein [Paenibacillus lutrae]|uniref:Uncharacterized protein n=1 Tax=Paenibacillus lutrae TaxID=2078573 RepID=A0A7X3FJW1_9BACL|nr:hypothetical protein [Paenibacillus lutrae]MVP01005.1 hypothetical protein [Paenibacillus lutrae]
MQNNLLIKFCLLGIFISLVVIAFKPAQQTMVPPSPIIPSTTIVRNDMIQVAPNIIAVRDDGTSTGIPGQLLIFEYDQAGKAFRYSGTTLNVQDYLTDPEKYGVPNKKTK